MSRQWEEIAAYGLRVGDTLLLPGGYETTITAITVYDLSHGAILQRCYGAGEGPSAESLTAATSGRWPILHIAGMEWNIGRFPSELLTKRVET